ncbi:hypothetical protein THS5294_02365 [Thalassobacter stenotrophicus]|uniref:Uncharacterized protein n=2 Tax=Thalassobacter stenotrophicus TaxID=266809 RepID=A0A0P1FK43_9RHOB|nr:hypothetical protein THS5294_02365 [Thalassobacter stenotrophicus]
MRQDDALPFAMADDRLPTQTFHTNAGEKVMNRLKLILFTLNNYAAYAQDRAGAEMFGGQLRRKRTMARRDLVIQALDGLRQQP